MRHAPAVLLLLLLLHAGGVGAQQFGLRTFGLEEGLPSASVWGLCEDRDGFLWVATEEGAARTDGLHFTTYGRADGLPGDEVTAIHTARDGRVWMGTRNGGVAIWEDGRIRVPSAPQPLPRTPVLAFAQDAGGVMHHATRDAGVIRWTADGPQALDTAHGLPAQHVRALVADAQGRLIAGTDSGLHMLQEGRWKRLPATDRLPGRAVYALHADSLGLLVGTLAGFTELDTALRPLPPMERFAGVFPLALPDTRVLSILRGRDDDLWVGTLSGLAHLTRQGGVPTLRMIGEVNGLGHDVVRAILQDRSGAIWAGTAFGGISRFTSDAFMHFTERDGLRSRIVTAIHRSPDGRLWMGTMGGGVAHWDEEQLRTYGAAEGLRDPMVLSLGEDREGHLLVGTTTGGLFRLVGERFTPVPLGNDQRPMRVYTILLDATGRTWVGTMRGLYAEDAAGRFVQVPPADMAVHCLADGGDTLWVATDRGLHRVVPGGPPLALEPHGPLPVVPMAALARDSDGNLWIGTEGHGLYRLKGTRVDSIGTAEGLTSRTVEQVLLDSYENVWLGTRRGIHLLELDALQERIINIRHYGAQEGFIGVETFRNACLLDLDSTLWFGSVRGATRYDPDREVQDREEPVLHLTDLRLFFEPVDWTPWASAIGRHGIPEGLVLPHNKNHLTFAFTGISLAHPEKVRYRHILEGYDPDWSPIGPTDRVTYSNIPPGEYTFRVMARNGSGIWTEEPVSLRFVIKPPFWATTPFRAGAGAVLVLGILAVVRMREQRLRRDRERLERTVAQRTRELATEKDRSERLLLNILPATTAEELKERGTAQARSHPACTVLFSDFTGFTAFSGHMDKEVLVAELDHFFRLFDQLCDQYGIEKIKTIGDAYMCAAGLPTARASHALDGVLMALGMLHAVARSNADRRAQGRQEWPVRVGLHSGPVISGVVGEKKFAYDIWGDTVNLASRMESNGAPGRVNISGSTYAEVMDVVEVQPRGPVKVKGKGELHMYYVLRLKPEWSADPAGLVPNDALLALRDGMNG